MPSISKATALISPNFSIYTVKLYTKTSKSYIEKKALKIKEIKKIYFIFIASSRAEQPALTSAQVASKLPVYQGSATSSLQPQYSRSR